MSTLFAQPYNIDATGFTFDSVEDYQTKAETLRDIHGNPVEEFEIQMIDAAHIDCDLFEALGVCQVNIEQFFDAVDDWSEEEKQRVIIAVGECGYTFEESSTPNEFDVDIYEMESLKELAEHFVEEGLYGDIPDNIRMYLDMEAIGRDLGADYTETTIAGKRIVYRCG